MEPTQGRSGFALAHGVVTVAELEGGLHNWQTLGLPVEPGSAESEASDAHQLGALATESDLATNPLRSRVVVRTRSREHADAD